MAWLSGDSNGNAGSIPRFLARDMPVAYLRVALTILFFELLQGESHLALHIAYTETEVIFSDLLYLNYD
jgi:hypothetical protein